VAPLAPREYSVLVRPSRPIVVALALAASLAPAQDAKAPPSESEVARDLYVLLTNERYDELEAALDALVRERRAPGDYVSSFDRALDRLVTPREAFVRADKWCKTRPRSWQAPILRGLRERNKAWEARARSDTAMYVERIGYAKVDFARSFELHKNPFAAACLVTIVAETGEPDAAKLWFERAVECDPGFVRAYEARLEKLDRDAWLPFARDAAKDHPDEPALAVLVAQAHLWQAGRRGKHPDAATTEYLKQPAVSDEIRSALDRVIAKYPAAALPHVVCAAVIAWIVPRDGPAFLAELEKAAELGDITAARSLAQWRSEGSNGLAKDLAAVRKQTLNGARWGEIPAMFRWGEMLEQGFAGEPRDVVEAYRWYARAAELDDRVAAYRAGIMKLEGRDGLPADLVVAHRWIAQAADFAEPNAMLLLGRFLLKGVEKDGKVVIAADRATAKVWLERAAGVGNVEAKKLLESLAREPGK
jgi:hypothetical protein